MWSFAACCQRLIRDLIVLNAFLDVERELFDNTFYIAVESAVTSKDMDYNIGWIKAMLSHNRITARLGDDHATVGTMGHSVVDGLQGPV